MDMKRSGALPSAKGPEDYFTGTVRIDAPFKGSGAISGATVTFEPGARTAWHTHPLGQTLLVISGLGRVQREGGPVEEIRPGDIVWFEPDEKHWHGAAPDCAMSHIAIAEVKDGSAVRWMEKVSDADYMPARPRQRDAPCRPRAFEPPAAERRDEPVNPTRRGDGPESAHMR